MITPARTYKYNYKPTRRPIKVTSQMKYFAMIVRKIYNQNINKNFKKIQQYHSPTIKKLIYLDQLFKQKKSLHFSDILSYACKNNIKQQVKQNNLLLSLNILQKRYHKVLKMVFRKLNTRYQNFKKKQISIQKIIKRFQTSYQQYYKKQGFYKIHRIFYNFQKKKQGLQKLNKSYDIMLVKKQNQSLERIVKQIYHLDYQYLFKISDQKRRLFANYENQKRSKILMAKSDLHKYKNQIDLHHKNNEQIGDVRKQVRTKVINIKQNMKEDVKTLQQGKKYNQKLQYMIQKLQETIKNKRYLKQQANKQKSYEKVIRLYERIKYGESEGDQNKTVKQKLKNHNNFQNIKKLSQYYVKQNCKQKMLICFYQKTPIQILHLSKQFCRARSQNEILKEFIMNIIQIHIERGKNRQIKNLFQKVNDNLEIVLNEEIQQKLQKQKQKRIVRTSSSKKSLNAKLFGF